SNAKRRPWRKALFRELSDYRPGKVDPASQGLVDGADHLRRDSRDHPSRWNLCRLQDDRATRDDGALADHGPAIDCRVHPNQAVVANIASVDDRGMTDGDPSSQGRGHAAIHMHDHVVLDVRVPPDHDGIEIATEHGPVPNARAVLD